MITFYQVDNKNMYVSTCGNILKSYNEIIAVKKNGKIYLNADYYDYSVTTARHRNLFLGVTAKEFHENLKNGKYILVPETEIMRVLKYF